MICGEIGRQVRLHAVLASTRDEGFVKLSRIALRQTGVPGDPHLKEQAMADFLDSNESVDRSKLFLIRLRRCMPTGWAVELRDSNYCNRAERYLVSHSKEG